MLCVYHMFLHCLLSHLKASFHLFTAQHSKEWKLSTNHHPFWREAFLSQNIFRTSLGDFGIIAFFVQKERCKESRGTTTHLVKKQI